MLRSIGFDVLRRPPLSPGVAEYADGTDAEQDERRGFGHRRHGVAAETGHRETRQPPLQVRSAASYGVQLLPS